MTPNLNQPQPKPHVRTQEETKYYENLKLGQAQRVTAQAQIAELLTDLKKDPMGTNATNQFNNAVNLILEHIPHGTYGMRKIGADGKDVCNPHGPKQAPDSVIMDQTNITTEWNKGTSDSRLGVIARLENMNSLRPLAQAAPLEIPKVDSQPVQQPDPKLIKDQPSDVQPPVVTEQPSFFGSIANGISAGFTQLSNWVKGLFSGEEKATPQQSPSLATQVSPEQVSQEYANAVTDYKQTGSAESVKIACKALIESDLAKKFPGTTADAVYEKLGEISLSQTTGGIDQVATMLDKPRELLSSTQSETPRKDNMPPVIATF